MGQGVAMLSGALKPFSPKAVDTAAVVLGVNHASYAEAAGHVLPPAGLLDGLVGLFGGKDGYDSLEQMFDDPEMWKRFGNVGVDSPEFGSIVFRTMLRQTKQTFGKYDQVMGQLGRIDPTSKALEFLNRLRTEGPSVIFESNGWFNSASGEKTIKKNTESLKKEEAKSEAKPDEQEEL